MLLYIGLINKSNVVFFLLLKLLFVHFLFSQGTVDNVYEDVVWNRTSISDSLENITTMRFGTKEQVWQHTSVSNHQRFWVFLS